MERMKADGVRFNHVTWRELMLTYARAGQMADCRKLLERQLRPGQRASLFTEVIDAYATADNAPRPHHPVQTRRRWLEDARSILSDMETCGRRPAVGTYGALIKVERFSNKHKCNPTHPTG
jgi:hypothetical protein